MSERNATPEEAEELGANKYLGSAPYTALSSLANIVEDPEVQAKMPHISEALDRLAEGLGEVFDEINWAMDPENPVQDGAAGDRRALAAFKAAVGQDSAEVDE
jgi:hypothetical protein